MQRPASTYSTWLRFKRAVAQFLSSPAGARGIQWFMLLVCLLITLNLLNVYNSYVGRDWISAIEHKKHQHFTQMTWLYCGVFAALTIAAAFYRFAEERLALLWRQWQTEQLLSRYLERRNFYRLAKNSTVGNPDQRIAEDVRNFTATTLSFTLMLLNGCFTVVAFSSVLWSISPKLFGVAIIYATVGTAITVALGRPLVQLNNHQLDLEASFRAELLHVGEHSQAIATLSEEGGLKGKLLRTLTALVSNAQRMIQVNRHVGLFTTGYSYLIQVIPALVVAPYFMDGRSEFGVITQSAVAFTHLTAAFSLIVTQFQSISSYVAVIGRLDRFSDAMQTEPSAQHCPMLSMNAETTSITYSNLTLRDDSGTMLVHQLNARIEPKQRVLITGASGYARVALFEATAGLRCHGTGQIQRPDFSHLLFIPENGWLPRATLREMLQPPGSSIAPTDDPILEALTALQVGHLASSHGLDTEHDWQTKLGHPERTALAIARAILAKPSFVFFDRMTTTMNLQQAKAVLKLLASRGIGYLVLGKPQELGGAFDTILQLERDGSWSLRTVAG